MSDMDKISALLPIVERVARDVHFIYGIDEEEAYGLLALEVVEKARDYLILHTEGQVGLIEKRLKQVAAKYARAERVKRSGEMRQYFYDPEYIRLFLPFAFDLEDWDQGPTPDDSAARWRTGEALDTALDIQAAWPRLKEWQSRVIVARHMTCRPNTDGGVDWLGIAEVAGYGSAASAQSRYADATRELAVEMNTARAKRLLGHEGPGARKAVSNATANTLISQGR